MAGVRESRLPGDRLGGCVRIQQLPGLGQGSRVINLYFNGQRIGGSADISRIADHLAELLERELTYARD